MKAQYMIMAAITALTITSCKESVFLDNPPQATVSEELLMTPEGSDQLCTAAYAALMGPNPQDWSVCWYPVTHWSTGSVRADDAYKGGGGTGDGAIAERRISRLISKQSQRHQFSANSLQ